MKVESAKLVLDACQQAAQLQRLLPPLPEGITPRCVRVIEQIRRLSEEGGPVRVSDISEILDVTRPGITNVLRDLEELGYVEKRRDEADSRNVVELRGSMMRNWCAKCEKFLDFSYIPDSPTPIAYCNVDMCGDYVRPAIVLGEEPFDLDLLAQAMEQVRSAEVLLVDGSAMGIFPVPNLLKAYQGHQLVLFNTPPLVFDKIAGLTVRDAGSFSDIFSQLELEL